MTKFRFRWMLRGGHVWVRVFTYVGEHEVWALAGTFRLSEGEWFDFQAMLAAWPETAEFVEEPPEGTRRG